MQLGWDILYALLHCKYKAWQLAYNNPDTVIQLPILSDDIVLRLPVQQITNDDKQIVNALYYLQQKQGTVSDIRVVKVEYIDENLVLHSANIRIGKYTQKIRILVEGIGELVPGKQAPQFYKNAHCHECQFWDNCYSKLKEKDCISLLTNISPKVISKFHKKGVYSITQLSNLFRPRRRRRHPQVSTNYLWELKALAITKKQTYVLHPPDLKETEVSIFMDFEGLPNENWIYLIGALIKEKDKQDRRISFWADTKENEKRIFVDLFKLLEEFPEGSIYHYGSYELKVLRLVAKKWPGDFKNKLALIEARSINLLSFLRTHIYPPIYSNGLKELAHFLGFQWTTLNADGLLSIEWRKDWETTNQTSLKETLLQYNQDDCTALSIAKQWFSLLASNAVNENVQQVAEIKKQSLYKFQNNPELGTDFQFISKAAYFDYQRTKIYWRNKNTLSQAAIVGQKPKAQKKGAMVWQPKKINEVILLPSLDTCPKCGSKKVYQYKQKNKLVQTDLKFTKAGIKQYVIEYQSTKSKCAKCYRQYNSQNLRMPHYGNNLMAYITNLYISYNISNYMISSIIQEQFGIWISPMYLVMRKEKWWQRWNTEAEYIWQIIRHSPVIHIDETSIQLEKKNGYVWVFATAHTVFYHYSDTREGGFLHEWLKDYKGVIVTDFFPSYESIPVKRQKCLIHLIRDLNDDLFKNPFDNEYKAIVVGFNTLLRKIIETIDRYGLTKVNLQKHHKDIEQFLHQFVQGAHKSELAIKYCKRFQKHWEQLWIFLDHDGVPWNNNNAEAAVKAFAQYRRGVKGMIGESGLREYLKMLSIAQTCRYRNVRFLSFIRYKVGMWQNVPQDVLPGYLPFNQAKQYVHKLGFQRKREWLEWSHSDKRPSFIPLTPNSVYKKEGWANWSDWVGFSFLPFEKARTYMRKLGLKNRDEYWKWLQSGKRPKTIPYSPEIVYKKVGWKDLGDWLGTGNTGRQKKSRLPYEQAKAYVQALGIKTQHEYFAWRNSGERPETIPSAPNMSYHEFEGWGVFLGTGRIANQNKEFWDYEQATAYLKPLNIRSYTHFKQLHKEGKIPIEIPRNPCVYYKKQGRWLSYTNFWGR